MLDSLVIGAIISGAVALVSSIGSTISNSVSNKSNLDYNDRTNSDIMGREDNYLQRRVADAENAGLSPLAAIEGSSGSTNISAIGGRQDSVLDGSALSSSFSDILNSISGARNADVNKQRMLNDKEVSDADTALRTRAQELSESIASNNQKNFVLEFANKRSEFAATLRNAQSESQAERDLKEKIESLARENSISVEKIKGTFGLVRDYVNNDWQDSQRVKQNEFEHNERFLHTGIKFVDDCLEDFQKILDLNLPLPKK